LASNYTLKYKHFVKKLILLSPVGLLSTIINEEKHISPDKITSEDGDCAGFEDLPKLVGIMLDFTWKHKITP